MTFKGSWMLCLMSISGSVLPGCWQSAALPPSASLNSLGGMTPVNPRPGMIPPTVSNDPVANDPPVVVPEQVERWKPPVKQRDWKYSVLHHTASSGGSVESIHETHLRKKDANGKPWLGIGYHFVIGNGNGMPDGSVESTFRWREQMHGAHAGVNDFNQYGIGIVLVGNFEDSSPSAAQMQAAQELVGTLQQTYSIPDSRVIGHNDVKATACPGQNFSLDRVRSAGSVPADQFQSVNSTQLQLSSVPVSNP